MSRYVPLMLVLVVSASSTLFAVEKGERGRAFVRSLELFDAATSPQEYLESASALESILSDGFRSGVVYYNLGNAYFRAGEYGRAILNYRKARPYRPRDPYLLANLEQALASAPGRLAEPPRPWWTHVLFWTDWISYPGKIRTIFCMVSLAAVSFLGSVFFRDRRLQIMTAAMMIGAAAFGVDTFLSHADIDSSTRAVITKETIARKGTGMSYEAAFDQPLRDGAEFTVLAETSDWTFGRFENIGDGWVRNECVAR